MKFTIKHALVVAISALCICVVATGTVLAVTMGNRGAEAAGNAVSVTIQFWNEDNTPAEGHVRSAGSDIEAAHSKTISWVEGTTIFIAAGGAVSHISNVYHVAGGAGSHWFSPTLTRGTQAGFQVGGVGGGFFFLYSHWVPAAQVAGNRLLTELAMTFAMTGSGITSRTIRIIMSPGAQQIFWDASGNPLLTITRRANTSNPAVLQREQGWHNVVTATANTAGTIPAPTDAQMGGTGTFRGWSFTQNGAIVFPVGLPMPVFSDMEIWAIRN